MWVCVWGGGPLRWRGRRTHCQTDEPATEIEGEKVTPPPAVGHMTSGRLDAIVLWLRVDAARSSWQDADMRHLEDVSQDEL